MNISEVIGQNHVKRVIEIALAGKHNILLVGPQGSGKTMWKKVISRLIIDLGEEPNKDNGYWILDNIVERIVANLNKLEKCCEIYMGIDGSIIATSRLCPCGNINHPHHECRCEVDEVIQYRNQMPRRILREFDLIVELKIPRYEEFRLDFSQECSFEFQKRIEEVYTIQQKRFSEEDIQFNSQMPFSLIKTHCSIGYDTNKLLQLAVKELCLCVGDYLSILRVARTIADMVQSEVVQAEHIAEAIQYSSFNWFKA